MNYKLKSASFFLAAALVCGFVQKSNAGTGWVGNSPLLLAASSSGMSFLGTDFDRSEMDRPNLLLLSKGTSRLTLGFGSSLHQQAVGILGFDYGLSNIWTLLNLSALAYNLKSGGVGEHQFALYFGVINGVRSGNEYENFSIGPGIGLLHGFESGRWKFTNSLDVATHYMFSLRKNFSNDSHFLDSTARLRINVAYRLGDQYSIGLGAQSSFSAYTSASGYVGDPMWRLSRLYQTTWLIDKPSISLSRRILDKGVLTWSLGSQDSLGAATGAGLLGSYLAFTTDW